VKLAPYRPYFRKLWSHGPLWKTWRIFQNLELLIWSKNIRKFNFILVYSVSMRPEFFLRQNENFPISDFTMVIIWGTMKWFDVAFMYIYFIGLVCLLVEATGILGNYYWAARKKRPKSLRDLPRIFHLLFKTNKIKFTR